MRARLVATIAAAATVLVALLAPAGAVAATDVGDDCAGTFYGGSFNLVPEDRTPGVSTLPLTAPVGGVVTRWNVRSANPDPASVRMGVFRSAGSPGKFQLVAESKEETAVNGANGFPTRIPVETGDRFGVVPAGDGYFACVTGIEADQTWSYKGTIPVGSSQQFSAGVEVRVPIVAAIEPDADRDGFGDESQDGCPRSSSYIAPCPLVQTAFKMKVRERAIVVRVGVSSEASVQVFGQVSWQVRQKPGQSAQRSRRPGDRGLTVGLSAGGPRPVSAGETKTFRVPLPKTVLRRLGRITPRQSLRALMTVRTTDLAGKVTDQRKRLKLTGREGA